MRTFTAQSTLSFANRAHANKASVISKRLQVVVPVLGVALVAALVSSICISFLGPENGDATKALLSINVLSILLSIAGVYSLIGVFWNAYWVEREKRVDVESELRETVDSIPAFFKAACIEIPKLESFQALVAENEVQVDSAPEAYFGIAANLADKQFVSGLRMKVGEVLVCDAALPKEHSDFEKLVPVKEA